VITNTIAATSLLLLLCLSGHIMDIEEAMCKDVLRLHLRMVSMTRRPSYLQLGWSIRLSANVNNVQNLFYDFMPLYV